MRRRDFVLILGATMIVPHALRAQQKATPVIGFLGGEDPSALAANVAAFRRGLSEAGYVEGKNVAIEYRWAEGRHDRLPVWPPNSCGAKSM